MGSDDHDEIDIPVTLRVSRKAFQAMRECARAEGVTLDSLASTAAESQFGQAAGTGVVNYFDAGRSRPCDTGNTGAAEGEELILEGPRPSDRDPELAARIEESIQMMDHPPTRIHPQDLELVPADGELVLTVAQLLTRDQIERANGYWMSQPDEVQVAAHEVLKRARRDLLRGQRVGTEGLAVSGSRPGAERSRG
jgi:hypothetical protein